ncbi:protein unc-45 homolog B-like [Temnothorax curvispinosus]|uniref:Protein unc-45 homolog B n=1 Tax=Temnothorax curvispinosus TaxID=300111 RepID=A0A6J1QR75_9HYME|nr:protein unc-45 homolog B-like [Temnothorax curvispinosus]
MAESNMTAQEWKEKGNEEFNKGNWSEALSDYTNALNLVENNAEKTVYYKNRAAAYLKLNDYENALEDCDSALKICCNKALYRRCQALEALERFEEAHWYAEIIISSDPNNKVIQPVKERLHKIVQGCRKDPHLSATISKMMDSAFNDCADKEEYEYAMSILFVYACDEAGAEEIFKNEGVSKLAQLIKVEENEKAMYAICILGKLCKNNINRTESVVKYIGLLRCLEMMNSPCTDRVNESQICLQNILNTYSGMNDEPDSKPNKTLCEIHKNEFDMILSYLLNNIANRTITGLTRDAIIELIMCNIHHTELGWAKQLIKFRGLQKLMEVASEMEGYKYKESSINITSSTRIKTSMCLTKIYENMYYDAAKKEFIDAIEKFIKDKLLTSDSESKVRGVVAITTLMFGPLDVVYAIMIKRGVLEMIVAMSEANDVFQKKVVCECVIVAMTKFKQTNVFICRCVRILENLYTFSTYTYTGMYDSIRVRALVGLCIISKFEKSILSSYTTIEPFAQLADGTIKKLTKVCAQFLINPKKEEDMRKWAIKGLRYLTIIFEVKEKLIKDRQQAAVKAIIELTETKDQSVLYDVTIMLANLCCAYDDNELIPEMIESVMFIKYYFSGRDQPKKDDFMKISRRALVEVGVTSALVRLAKTDNQNCRELVARVFHAICSQQELREIVVQQGGAKALLSLVLSSTDKGKNHASRALVHLAHTIPPAFPDQIIKEIVWTIINLLNSECSVNERCEALTALCNLASVNNSMREHIFIEIGFEKFEDYMRDDNNMLKRKAAQLINNLVLCPGVAVQYCEQRSYQVGYLTLLFEDKDKDIDTIKALAGTIAMLTAVSKEACDEIIYSDPLLKFLYNLLTNPDGDLQHKGTEIALNMMRSTKDLDAKLIKTNIIRPLTALSENDTVPDNKIKELARTALLVAAHIVDIETNDKSDKASQNIDSLEHVD